MGWNRKFDLNKAFFLDREQSDNFSSEKTRFPSHVRNMFWVTICNKYHEEISLKDLLIFYILATTNILNYQANGVSMVLVVNGDSEHVSQENIFLRKKNYIHLLQGTLELEISWLVHTAITCIKGL